MKLSMWVLQRWFAELKPISIIRDGTTDIEGVRLFTEHGSIDNRYVYVGSMKDFFPRNDSVNVLLIHKNDMISLESDDREEIINQIITAFEYYSHYEYELLYRAQEQDAEQKIVNLCAEILGPAFLMTPALEVAAFSDNCQDLEINRYWNEFAQRDGFSAESIKKSYSTDYFRHFSMKNHNYVWNEPSAAPYEYGIMNSYYDEAGKMLGQAIISLTCPPGPAELQIAEMVTGALNQMRRIAGHWEGDHLAERMLEKWIHGRWVPPVEAERLTELRGWKPGELYFVIAVETSGKATDQGKQTLLSYLKKMLEAHFRDSLFLIADHKILACINSHHERAVEALPAIQDGLNQVLSAYSVRAGYSLEFQDLTELLDRIRQANDALRYAEMSRQKAGSEKPETGDGGALSDFRQYGSDVLAASFEKEYTLRCSHPAVQVLTEYDNAHGTAYAVTLCEFLRQERSYVRTAEVLYLHKNTVLYRIARIRELYPVVLEDAGEREYLMYSFRIRERLS